MLHAHLMIGPNDTALEKRPHAFDVVRVNVSTHPFFPSVLNALMCSVRILDSAIGRVLVGHDALGLVGHVLSNEGVKDFARRLLAGIQLEMCMAAALDSSEYHSLVADVSAPDV